MELTGYEARRLQELERRLVVEDPDLASLLSTGLEEPQRPEYFSPRRAPHGPPAGNTGTALAMLLALGFLVVLVAGALALSGRSAGEQTGSECQNSTIYRDADCTDLRRYVPGG